VRLKLLLIAIEARRPEGAESCLAINPGPELKIEAHIQGFFIAESADDVKRSVKSPRMRRSSLCCAIFKSAAELHLVADSIQHI
jgi:hypothetical protein